ncbi:Multidrug resistance protein MdtH [Mycobacterium simulans]|uniref:MFS transporter n=1 Tax=Mycobacterium simulans TaxID=627089 RepID=UPI0017480F4D|nr:MFS transporter [Mycobacterium simulans]SON59413.1 Multidrug resistance protein MdtH [Mycobacterium simulans]
MREIVDQFCSFNRTSQVLMINYLGINTGFFMLMPYLAGYLAGPLGLAAWAVGLVLGVRNFTQQGMFFLGGSLADRFGYKPVIVAGCLLQTGAFVLLGIAQSLPSLLIAATATGVAGALYTPAVRAYVAADSADRKLEAFAMFNIFFQTGVLLGPLLGVALLALNFTATILAAAAVFAILTVAQLLVLPQSAVDPEPATIARNSVLEGCWLVIRNRSFMWFAAIMTGRYILAFQVHFVLPLQASSLAPRNHSFLVAAMFAVSGLVTVVGQLRITQWFAARWGTGRSLVVAAIAMAASFVPLTAVPNASRFGLWAAVAALLLSTALLHTASAIMFPFEMRKIAALAGDQLVATHYGFYSTIVGVGVLVGNLAIGSLLSAAHQFGADEVIWVTLILVGLLTAVGLHRLDTSSAVLRPTAKVANTCAAG